jgi:hypothetical protein
MLIMLDNMEKRRTMSNMFRQGGTKMKELYLESGEKATFWDVCEYWSECYPSDIFVSEPEAVVQIRTYAEGLLKKRKDR